VLVGALSGGLRRRTIVATALTGDPELLVLDEPSTGLDPVARRNVGKVLRQKANEGRTVVLTTHYVDEAQAVADKVAIFDSGKVKVCDRPEVIRSSISGLFRLTVTKELGIQTSEMAELAAVLRGMGLSDVEGESDGTIIVHVKADERQLLSTVFDWGLKNGLTTNISPITLEDAYVELVK
jgi:ABC-2 type transport system ATP-binding protein